MGKRGRTPRGGRCECGYRYRRFHATEARDLSTPVRNALARTNAVRWIGTDTSYLGVVIHQAITENA